jgi:acyl-CoA synthetase (AMP-forming)/AMP-acid ligase II
VHDYAAVALNEMKHVIEEPDMTTALCPVRMADYVRVHGRTRPMAPAAAFMDRTMSYSELDAEVALLARALLAAGVKKGETVAVLSTPRPEFLIAFLATIDIGAVWVGLNPLYRAEDLARTLADAKPVLILAIAEHEGQAVAPRLAKAQEVAGMAQTVFFGSAEQTLAAFLAGAEGVDDAQYARARAAVMPDDPAMVVYTSGSSGAPKGAVLSHRSLAEGARMQVEHFGIERLSVVCNFPVNHVACVADVCCTTLVKGGELVFQEKFDPIAMLLAIERKRITLWGGVPTMFELALAHPQFTEFDLSSVQLIFWAGAAMQHSTVVSLQKLGIPLMTGYGMTETAAQVTFSDRRASADVLSSTIGRPDRACEVRIVDAGQVVRQVGVSGELQVRAPFLMLGYRNRDGSLDRSTFTDNGFLRTGDVGAWTDAGDLRLEGRMSEMFKSGGYRIHPSEIEAVVAQHPAVELCAVVAVPDSLYQEVCTAFLQLRRGFSLSAEEARDFCRERLARYKVPKRFVVLEALPLLPVGKIDKSSLRRLQLQRGD